MSTVDLTYIAAALEGQLGDTLSGTEITFVRTGDAPPDGADAWCNIVAVDCMPRARNQAGPQDWVDFVCAVNVAVGAGQTNAHALAGAMARVARAIEEWTDDDRATSGHLLETGRARVAKDPGPFEASEIRTGSVIVTGHCQRATGSGYMDVLS
jgi:hypothetical protein